MNTRKIAFPTPSQPPHRDLWRKEGSLELGVILDLFLIHNPSKNSFICSGALAAASDDVRKIASSQSSSSLSFSADARKGAVPFHSSATSNCEPHDFIRLRASATVGLESREADGCPSFLEKRDRRELSFLIESRSQCTQTAPSRTSRACSMPKQKTQQSCVSSGVKITRTRIQTLPKRLASARHSRVRKLYSYQIHSARFKQTSQWRRKSWWCILPAATFIVARR